VVTGNLQTKEDGMNTEATELKIYIENDGRIYESSTRPIYKNLATKKAKGEYVHDLAVKAFLHLATFGAKNYHREHGSMGQSWSQMFDTETRRQVAEAMTAYFETEWRLGNFRDLLPKKYQSKSK